MSRLHLVLQLLLIAGVLLFCCSEGYTTGGGGQGEARRGAEEGTAARKTCGFVVVAGVAVVLSPLYRYLVAGVAAWLVFEDGGRMFVAEKHNPAQLW